MRRRRAHLAALLRAKRVECGFSTTQLAAYVGVSVKTYRAWERGTRSVQAEYLPDLARRLCVSVRDLADVLDNPQHAAVAPRVAA